MQFYGACFSGVRPTLIGQRDFPGSPRPRRGRGEWRGLKGIWTGRWWFLGCYEDGWNLEHAPPTPRRPRVGGRHDWMLDPSHRVAAIPPGSAPRCLALSGGVASLNHRLMAVMPSASCALAADFSGDRDRIRRPSIQSLRPPTRGRWGVFFR